MADGKLILIAGALLAAGLVASLVAGRVKVPALALFLGVGMAIGSDGAGWIHFNDYELARTIGIVALALILFEGGLNTGLPAIRPVLGASLSLAVIGTLLTAVITGLAAASLFGLSTLEGLLLGSVVASTDGAAIFSLLRGSTLRRRVALSLEAESGLNDPVAVLLVLGFVNWIQMPDYGIVDMLGQFVLEMAVGGGVGALVGWIGVQGLRRVRLASGGLFPVASLAIVALAFGAAAILHGSGFLAVYVAGLALGGATIPAKQTITIFHQGLAWVAQLSLFFSLGLLVFPSSLDDVALKGTLLAIVLVLVARPIAVFGSLALARFDVRDKLAISWAGLRGAVPVVLATFPVIDGVPSSTEFFNIVFFAVLLSTIVQGATFEPFARWLGVTTNEPAVPRPLAETGTIRGLGANVVEYPVGVDDAIVGHRVRDLGLPRDALVNVIVRGDQAIPPRGSTRLEAGDRLHVLVREEQEQRVTELLDHWRDGPVGPPPRPELQPRSSPSVFSVRPWREAADGSAAHPAEIAGAAVVEHLRTRRDEHGALVLLEDGRFAITGPTLAVGGRSALTDYARRRALRAPTDSERAWWEEVIGALAL